MFIYYKTDPHLSDCNVFDLLNILSAIEQVEQNIDDLTEFSIFMNNFDSVCLNCIHIECNKIKKYICDMINKKTFDLNFDHNMNEDGIEKAIYENFCLNQIKYEFDFMANDLKSDIDKIKEPLSKKILYDLK